LIAVATWVLLSGALPASAAAMAPAGDTFDPSYAGIEPLQRALASRQISCERLVRFYLDRIARLNQRGPWINAIIRINERVLDEARRRDAEGMSETHAGALNCIPFIAKDNIDTAGAATTAGSIALSRSLPEHNAFVIQRLLDAGALLVGKANMSELAASYGRFGYSSAGGLTVNPYNLDRDASGSSSGSAAAVAADFAAFALGTDTSGSVRAPASVTGLVGVRPTMGLVSRAGVVPSALSFDTVGVLTHTVADAAVVLATIAGPDLQDAGTTAQPAAAARSLVPLPARDLRGVRLGVIDSFRGGDAEVDANEARSLRTFAAHGAVLVPITLPQEFLNLWDAVLALIADAEFRPQFERYLRSTTGPAPRTLRQLIEQVESLDVQQSAHPVNPLLIEALRRADAMQFTDSALYIHLLTSVLPTLRADLRRLMEDRHVTALVVATMACAATPRFDRPDSTYRCRARDPYAASYLASVTGFPEITIPAGMTAAKLPTGVSLLGRPFEDAQLLALAQAAMRVQPPLPHPDLHESTP
jgi:amidase